MEDIATFIEQIKSFVTDDNELVRYLLVSVTDLVDAYKNGEYDKEIELKKYIEKEIKVKSALLLSKIDLGEK